MRVSLRYAARVTAMRRLVRRHDRLAMLLILAALVLKMLVPVGFMPVAAADGTITVQICSGDRMTPRTMQIAIPGLPAGHGDKQQPPRPEMPCAFAGLAMPMVGGADAALLVTAIAFVLAIAIMLVANPPFISVARLRPPLRGPPAFA